MNNNNNKYKQQQQQQPAQLLVDLSTMGSVLPRSSRRVRREALRGWRSIVMSRMNSLFLMSVLSCSLDDHHHIVITEVSCHSVCETWIRSRAGHNISLSAPGLNCVGDTTTQQPGLARLCLVTLPCSALLLPINRISVGSHVQMWVWWWS